MIDTPTVLYGSPFNEFKSRKLEYNFFIIKGIVRDENSKPIENITVTLKFQDSLDHDFLAISRTNLNGEYYFEESLKVESELVIECKDESNSYKSDKHDFILNSDKTLDFVLSSN